MDDQWVAVQDEINHYLSYLLLRVENHYGENRAPYCFPAQFEAAQGEYRCIITEDYTGEYGKTVYAASTPDELIDTVKARVIGEFGLSSIFESPEPE